MKISEVLENAAFAAMIPGLWIRGAYAKDISQNESLVLSQDSCEFCVIGILASVTGVALPMQNEALRNAKAMLRARLPEGIAWWNDKMAEDAIEVAENLWLAAQSAKAGGN